MKETVGVTEMDDSRLSRFFPPGRLQELRQDALESTLCGIPVCEMTHDEVLVTLGVLIERLDTLRKDVFSDLREGGK